MRVGLGAVEHRINLHWWERILRAHSPSELSSDEGAIWMNRLTVDVSPFPCHIAKSLLLLLATFWIVGSALPFKMMLVCHRFLYLSCRFCPSCLYLIHVCRLISFVHWGRLFIFRAICWTPAIFIGVGQRIGVVCLMPRSRPPASHADDRWSKSLRRVNQMRKFLTFRHHCAASHVIIFPF